MLFGPTSQLFQYIQQTFPKIDTIHVQSDGPSSQYRNRFNFFYITKVQDIFPELNFLTWNFSIAGHGKGAADGIRAVVKRSADMAVNTGNNVTNVSNFVYNVQPLLNKVKLVQVEATYIEKKKNERPKMVTQVPGNLQIHQVTWSSSCKRMLSTRKLSCFSCSYNDKCEHYSHDSGSIVLEVLDSENDDDRILFNTCIQSFNT